jgi:D-alanyl-D-alanine carboxypeptidase
MSIERLLNWVQVWATSLLGIACVATAAIADPSADALDALIAAYPDALSRHDGNRIYWRDGTVMAASDGKVEKTFEQFLKAASILDQFHLPYPRGRPSAAPAPNVDPGRFRNEAFFRKMYGDCTKGEVERNLVSIVWLPKSFGKTIKVSKVNGIAKRLEAVSAEIDALPDEIKRAAHPIAGVLSCRPVADTGRMSMHGYAAAIDLNLAVSDYWLWQAGKRSADIPYRNRMPYDIVDIFERHGFIWGGKWYHYDTMHFEYRPELLGMPGQ